MYAIRSYYGIDSIDYQLIELLAKRMQIVEKIRDYKNQRNISVFQVDRWKKIRDSRIKAAGEIGLNVEFVKIV